MIQHISYRTKNFYFSSHDSNKSSFSLGHHCFFISYFHNFFYFIYIFFFIFLLAVSLIDLERYKVGNIFFLMICYYVAYLD